LTTTWTNWSGSITCHPRQIFTPATEAELVALVAGANRAGQTIRVAGTGHSFVPLCASNGLLISLDGLQGVVAVDQPSLRATVWAGTKIHQLGEPLLAAGMALENQGDIDRQAIAGAVSTGTHGTGPGIGSMSTQVAGLRIVTASGEIVECSAEHETDIFQAARLSLGTLGVISQITLRLLPAFRLHERTWVVSFEECTSNLDAHIAATRHFEFFWSPREDVCAMKALQPTAVDLPAACGLPPDALGRLGEDSPSSPPPRAQLDAASRLGRYVKSERVDWSYRIFPSERNVKFNECEFSLPAADGPDALREIRALMLGKHRDVLWPIEYRTLGADDIDLGTAQGRATIAISVHQAAELPYQAFFADVEAIFRNHHGRPHWGKWHSHTARELRALYPHWDHFQSVRARLDPYGRFLNDYLRRLLDE
jgi:FAD-linked oxidoreductase